MNNLKRTAALAALLLGLTARGFAVELITKDDMELNVGGRMQLFGLGQTVKDPHRTDARVFLFMKQSRLMFFGRYENYKYYVELAFAGEEEVANKNASLNLLDYYFDVPLGDAAFVKLGQFKIPYSRERITSSGEMLFAERSIQSLAFKPGRDVGVAVHGGKGALAGVFGVFTGGGRDVPERYLPEKLGFPLVALRLGVNNNLDKDVFTLSQTDHAADRVKTAVFLNALYTKDTIIGHSTVLNVKTSDKNLLLNPNWNPYIVMTPYDKGDLWQAGADAALRAPLGSFTFTGEIEGNTAEFHNNYGTLNLAGGRAQIGLYKKPIEAAVQYAFVIPDNKMAYYDTAAKKTYAVTGSRTIHQITPSVTYHLKKLQKAKIILDAPVLLNMPTFIEKGVGAYVASEQPDQTSVLKSGGRVKLQTVVEARMLFQLAF